MSHKPSDDTSFEAMQSGRKVEVPLPDPNKIEMAPMRDGVGLQTFIYLPKDAGPHPAILFRTPYANGITSWAGYGIERYLAAGYAVVFQMCRGQGGSEGEFQFWAGDREDGYDAVEWVASQPWCDGAVGMDGGSYVGSTQLLAAAAQPPHLRCIVPAVPSVDCFREIPFNGGILWRFHMLNWLKLSSVADIRDVGIGFLNPHLALSQSQWVARINMQPAIEAGDDLLEGEKLKQYRAFLSHPVIDEFWHRTTLSPQEYANIEVPVMLVSGTFDLNIGTMVAWAHLERFAPAQQDRRLLVGPWDHSQAYLGGSDRHGPFVLGPQAILDIQAERLAFFDRHLKGHETGDAARIRIFVTGRNEWRSFAKFPAPGTNPRRFFLHSAGHANSLDGDGLINTQAPAIEPPDVFTSDPKAPVEVLGFPVWDMRSIERRHDVLVYDSSVLEQEVMVVGEGTADIWTACDTPDADLFVRVQDVFPDGQSVPIAYGALRLRYREGFDREILMPVDTPTLTRIPLQFIAHTFLPGHKLRIQICATSYPIFDPNPNTGEPIASAMRGMVARQTIFHDTDRPSHLELPVADS